MKPVLPDRSPEENWTIGSLKWTGIRTASGEPTLGAWVAEMDFGTAPPVVEAMKKAIDDGLLGYQPSWLDGAVRDALVDFQQRRFGWTLDPTCVRTVQSVLPALDVVLRSMIPEGSRVIVPTPAYMPFLTMPGVAGHPIVEVPAVRVPFSDEGDRRSGGEWQLDVEAIGREARQGGALLILCNPWNPTGRAFRRDELEALWEAIRDTDVMIFADEIHSPLVLTDPTSHFSCARLNDEVAARTITATAASKGWNIAGLPCAQIIVTDDALREQWDESCGQIGHLTNSLGAIGTIAAYRDGDPWQDVVREEVASNMTLAHEALSDTLVDFVSPEATYLTWWGLDAYDWSGVHSPAAFLRENARVGVNAGATLGTGYENWIRVNLACSRANARRIIDAITSSLPPTRRE